MNSRPFSNETSHKIKRSEALFIDLDGTILDYKSSQKAAISYVFKELVDDKKIIDQINSRYVEINIQLWKMYEKKEIDLDSLRYRRFKQICDEFSIKGDIDDINKQYLPEFMKHVFLLPKAKDALELLKRKFPSIPKIIVTNGSYTVQRSRIVSVEIENLVDGIVTSDQVGASKPDPKIFYKAQEISKRPLDATWMIGDSTSSDMQGAFNTGMYSCYISEETTHQNEVNEPDLIVPSLYKFCKTFVSYYS